MLTKYMLQRQGGNSTPVSKDFVELLQARLSDLLALAHEFETFNRTTSFQHAVYTLLDSERLTALHGDLCRRLAAAGIVDPTTGRFSDETI